MQKVTWKKRLVYHSFSLHLVLINLVIQVISNKLDGGMLNKITKCVAEKFIQQGKTHWRTSVWNSIHMFFCCTFIQKRETERDRSVKKIWMIYSIYCTLFVKRLCLNFFLFRRDRFELQYSASFDQSSQILYHSHVFDTKREERYEYFDWFFELF